MIEHRSTGRWIHVGTNLLDATEKASSIEDFSSLLIRLQSVHDREEIVSGIGQQEPKAISAFVVWKQQETIAIFIVTVVGNKFSPDGDVIRQKHWAAIAVAADGVGLVVQLYRTKIHRGLRLAAAPLRKAIDTREALWL